MRSLPLLLGLLLITSACNRRGVLDGYAVLFSDDFNRSNQLLSATAAWTVYTPSGSTVQITSQRVLPAQGSGASPTALYATAATTDSVYASLDLFVSGGNVPNPSLFLLGRANHSNPASMTEYYACGFDGVNYLVLKRNGVAVANGTHPINFFDGDEYLLILQDAYDGISCKLTGDAEDYITYADPTPLTGGHFGFSGGILSYNFVYFDNFQVMGL